MATQGIVDVTEQKRLNDAREAGVPWKKWGPYLSERQWGTVREDYSDDGNAWAYFSHDQSRSRAYEWGEDGIGGISDDKQRLCFAIALWNERDPILKERLFGLTNSEGNHGEDVKEYYFYIDSTPTHSYMKYLYKYPQREYPYRDLVETNRGRTREDFEYELLDTGIFADNRYFDVFVEYAKEGPEDILIRVTVHNRGPESAKLRLLPTLWFRNTWSWGNGPDKPLLRAPAPNTIIAAHSELSEYYLYCDGTPELLFTENETNKQRLWSQPNASPFVKDAFHSYVVNGKKDAVNPSAAGTKAAAHYELDVPARSSRTVRLRLTAESSGDPFNRFEKSFEQRIADADEFYDRITPQSLNEDERRVHRQALAGMLWGKQFYYFGGRNVFSGGFLGLDNIGVFDRSAPLPTGGSLEQADGTAWMAFYCQCMLEIALTLCDYDPMYEEIAFKFIQHLAWIAFAMDRIGAQHENMWDEEDGFFYDVLRFPDGNAIRLKVRSMVGLLPLCASTFFEGDQASRHPRLRELIDLFKQRHPDLIARIQPTEQGFVGYHDRRLLSLLNRNKLERMLGYLLDENEFLGPYGIRSLSRYHEDHPFSFWVGSQEYSVKYLPAESNTGMFGGNSNWRGPVWMPVNALIVRGLINLYGFYGDDFKVQCPTGSGRYMNLFDVAKEIERRLAAAFLRDQNGRRPVYGGTSTFQEDPHWRDLILFYEYFHGDNGAGLGASHQTGWTGLIAFMMDFFGRFDAKRVLETSREVARTQLTREQVGGENVRVSEEVPAPAVRRAGGS
jgi:hypothetical protein